MDDAAREKAREERLTGSRPLTDEERIRREEVWARNIAKLQKSADALGVDVERLMAEGMPPRRDQGRECCDETTLKIELLRLSLVYAILVHRTDKWLGCQDWASRIRTAIDPLVQPANPESCWKGRLIWRASVFPFGVITPWGNREIIVHHAYAICPCTVAECGPGCLVLDPYTGWFTSWFQSPEIFTFEDWVKEANVHHCTIDAEWDQEIIYREILKQYRGRLEYRAVFETVRDEWRRHRLMNGTPEHLLDEYWQRTELAGLAP